MGIEISQMTRPAYKRNARAAAIVMAGAAIATVGPAVPQAGTPTVSAANFAASFIPRATEISNGRRHRSRGDKTRNPYGVTVQTAESDERSDKNGMD